ncbi:hypothetical protein YW3DRAFT_07114 [Streptomyces sp. MnatMP-M77]|uniref:hypothetical protein n=1 Tax=unclassified Streptomyces TaxID=2593676 RepID=UPI000804EEEC|nr:MULTISPECIES: hypothetical protein [unclassified Streptomyces]MYT79292.1 hypothetical protein [Streptomyces sp. SID8364]SBV03750.1 hypothetical protein YW3DRAFT_07114 [Streptomyces sp. MnatMP-M77]SCD66100.1 hypothetical protein GA0115261_1012314 [Streptomyces sp. OspMP-M43]
MTQVNAHYALDYSLKREQAQFSEEAERLAKQAAYIAANPPSEGRAVSGDITRLIQEAAFLLKRAATIEAGLEAAKLMNAETATTAK